MSILVPCSKIIALWDLFEEGWDKGVLNSAERRYIAVKAKKPRMVAQFPSGHEFRIDAGEMAQRRILRPTTREKKKETTDSS